MNKICTYIFVHEQERILSNDVSRKFQCLPNMKYVFLGMRDTSKICGRKDVIIAKDIMHNIEIYPRFCSFTGWYVLWKNNLIKSEYIHLFEYDIALEHDFNTQVNNILDKRYDFVGYVPLSISFGFLDPRYLANILSSIQKHWNVNAEQKILKIYNRKKSTKWSSSSNSTFSLQAFDEYMTWFEKLLDDLKDNPMCGHAHERSITLFNLLFNKKTILMHNLMKHSMLNSHKTGELKTQISA